jgi:type IV pilus assembly protein PilP
MKKHLTFIRKLAWLICLCVFALSCDQASAPPAKPKVVRKKIIAQKDKPGPQQPQKPEARKPQKPEKAPPKPKTPGPELIAEKDKSQPAAKPSAKPAISPKSDISMPEQIVAAKQPEAQQPEPDEKTLKADTKAAAKVLITDTKTPSSGTQQPATQAPRYNPKDKVDPFEPLFKQTTVVAKSSKKTRKKRVPRTPLERIDLSQLRLVAIVLAKSGNRAMVEESSGKGYIISKGTYIGTNAGKVTNIQKHRVVVAEEVEDVMGNVSIRKTELKLPKPPGEL